MSWYPCSLLPMATTLDEAKLRIISVTEETALADRLTQRPSRNPQSTTAPGSSGLP